MTGACELYLRVKSIGRGPVFIRRAKRNASYVIQLLGDQAISSYSSAEVGQLRDWCMKQGMSVPTVKRVFSSIRAIINLAIAEQVLEDLWCWLWIWERLSIGSLAEVDEENLICIKMESRT